MRINVIYIINNNHKKSSFQWNLIRIETRTTRQMPI